MTDRIEAIRARHAARLRTDAVCNLSPHPNDEDMAVLLEEVERYRDAFVRSNEAVTVREIEIAEAWQCAADRRNEARRYYVAWQNARMRAQDYRAALAPVAPEAEPGHPNDLPTEDDAEPTEWAWSPGDVVQDSEDGTVLARSADGIYPWWPTQGSDQRDQDITELVTKHGGRVLVCKARGIGVGAGESRG